MIKQFSFINKFYYMKGFISFIRCKKHVSQIWFDKCELGTLLCLFDQLAFIKEDYFLTWVKVTESTGVLT